MQEFTAQVSQVIAAAPQEVWKGLTTPATLKKFFFGAEVQSDWQVGHPIRMRGEYKGRAYEDKGEVLHADPARQLSFSHWSAMSGNPDTPENYHVVTFDLEPAGMGTRVTLSQGNLQGGVKPADVEHRSEYEKNWRSVLAGLAKAVEQ